MLKCPYPPAPRKKMFSLTMQDKYLNCTNSLLGGFAEKLELSSIQHHSTKLQRKNCKIRNFRTKTETNSNVHNQLDHKITKQSKVPQVKEFPFSFAILPTYNLPLCPPLPLPPLHMREETPVNCRLDSDRNLTINTISSLCSHYN